MSDADVGGYDELVMLAVQHVGEGAYGVPIRKAVEEVAEKPTSIGAIYAALDRLEQRGLVEAWQGEATPERGGRAKRYFRVTGAGERALAQAEQRRARLQLRPQGALQSNWGLR